MTFQTYFLLWFAKSFAELAFVVALFATAFLLGFLWVEGVYFFNKAKKYWRSRGNSQPSTK